MAGCWLVLAFLHSEYQLNCSVIYSVVAAVARKASVIRFNIYESPKLDTESSFTMMYALLKDCKVSLQVFLLELRKAKRV